VWDRARVERHEAIVAGAGPAGLAAAAALRRHGIAPVVLERASAVADRWRHRYDGLRLNTMRQFSRLPRRGMPRRYGRYPSRQDFVAYLEDYAARSGLEIRFETELERVDRGDDGDWRLTTSVGPLAARYAVVATGYDAVPHLPEWADGASFDGALIHAAQFRAAADYRDRDVLIVGAGNTGVDIAGLLHRAGARVAVAMRTPPNLFPRDLFGTPLQPPGIVLEHLPSAIGDTVGRLTQRVAFGNLEQYGLPRAPEGFVSRFRRVWVAPAIDDGFVAALKAGEIEITAPVRGVSGAEAVLEDGSVRRPHAIICATGYGRGLEPIVGHLGVLQPNGAPTHYHAAPENPLAPRLYFAGFYGSPGGQIRLFPKHARRIARAIDRDRATAVA
jgi:putative flavoprotein involved in K+ transport